MGLREWIKPEKASDIPQVTGTEMSHTEPQHRLKEKPLESQTDDQPTLPSLHCLLENSVWSVLYFLMLAVATLFR